MALLESHVNNLLQRSFAKLDPEIFIIPVDRNKYIVYAPLIRSAFIANAKAVNCLADLKGDWKSEGSEGNHEFIKLLRALRMVDFGNQKQSKSQSSKLSLPTAITLFLTTACNLRCIYCYASAGDTPLQSMSLETAIRGINFVASNAHKQHKESFSIAYHGGGEPTINWQVMQQSWKFAQQKASELNLDVYASTATNGVLKGEQIEWIVSNFAGVSVSFDGLPKNQNKNRITSTGKGSWQQVIHTLNRFDKADFSYSVRLTVTHDQISDLPGSVELISANFNPKRIHVEPAFQFGRWTNAPSAETQEFIDAYREAQGIAMGYGKRLHYSAARVDNLSGHFCGASQGSFSLSPDGNVSACYEVFSEQNPLADIFFYGTPETDGDGYVFDETTLENLRNRNAINYDFCNGCFAKWHCTGDCYHTSLTASRDGHFHGSDRCHITRELTKDQILEKIVMAGGLYWHEPLQETDSSPNR